MDDVQSSFNDVNTYFKQCNAFLQGREVSERLFYASLAIHVIFVAWNLGAVQHLQSVS